MKIVNGAYEEQSTETTVGMTDNQKVTRFK
jgi:hypothetical protein